MKSRMPSHNSGKFCNCNREGNTEETAVCLEGGGEEERREGGVGEERRRGEKGVWGRLAHIRRA